MVYPLLATCELYTRVPLFTLRPLVHKRCMRRFIRLLWNTVKMIHVYRYMCCY